MVFRGLPLMPIDAFAISLHDLLSNSENLAFIAFVCMIASSFSFGLSEWPRMSTTGSSAYGIRVALSEWPSAYGIGVRIAFTFEFVCATHLKVFGNIAA
jgi:hypothetical protein